MAKQYEVTRAFTPDGEKYVTRATSQEELREIPTSRMNEFLESGTVVVHDVDEKALAAAEKAVAKSAVVVTPATRK